MGGVCGAVGRKTKPGGGDERTERIRGKVAVALKKILDEEKAKEQQRKTTLEAIILRFDKSRAILKLIKEMFNELAGGTGSLDLNGLTRAMGKISSAMSKEDVRGLFEFIDLDDSAAIELKEFLVALVIGHVLEKIPIDPSSPRAGDGPEGEQGSAAVGAKDSVLSINTLMDRQEELKEMMTMIVNAHLLFDPLASGIIQRTNVEQILQGQQNAAGKNTKAKKSNPLLSDDRWKEMDWNSDGSIDFAEFVFAFCSWVDLDDDMEEDE